MPGFRSLDKMSSLDRIRSELNMLEPQKIPLETVGTALKQAQHYRLLNEPSLAESICRDVLAVDGKNEDAWVTLLLALTDQFQEKRMIALDEAHEAVRHLSSEYKTSYYSGIIEERWARMQHKLGAPAVAVDPWIRKAMNAFSRADELAPEGDPNAMLRWNTCARFLQETARGDATYMPASPNAHHEMLDEFADDVPLR